MRILISYTDDLATKYEAGDIIVPEGEWSTDSLLLYDQSTQPGQFEYDNESFVLFKRESPGETTKFGWLGISRIYGYGQYGTFTVASFMK